MPGAAGARAAFSRSAGAGALAGDLLYFQGMSWLNLGDGPRASAAFDALLEQARAGLAASPAMDFFAKFGEKESAGRRDAGFRYLKGLAFLGTGATSEGPVGARTCPVA